MYIYPHEFSGGHVHQDPLAALDRRLTIVADDQAFRDEIVALNERWLIEVAGLPLTTTEAVNSVRRQLALGVLSIEELMDLASEELDVIEAGVRPSMRGVG